MADVSLFILRVVIGAMMAAHGSQAMLGQFRGQATVNGKTMRVLDTDSSSRQGYALSAIELVGGLLFALWLETPLGAVMVFASMLVAVHRAHWSKGFYKSQRGYEWPLVFLVVVLAVGLAGPVFYSADPLWGLPRQSPWY